MLQAQIQGRVADQNVPEGQSAEFRQGRGGDLIVNLAGRYGELARRGRLFHGVTAVAGVAPGTAIGTTAAIALANPMGSEVDLYVMFCRLLYKSGTLGTGHVDWIAHLDNLILPTGTAIPIVSGRLGGPSPQGRLLTTATVLTGGTVFRPLAYLAPVLATTVTESMAVLAEDDVDGAIVIPPGHSVSIQGTTAAGTSPLVRYGVAWAEELR